MSRHTVGYHLRQIYRRLGVSSRVELTGRMLESMRAEYAMFDAVMDGVTVLEPIHTEAGEITDFLIVYANPSSIDYSGRHMSELVGIRLLDAYPTSPLMAQYARVFASAEPLELREHGWEHTTDGVQMVTFYDLRAIRHDGNVVVAHRRIRSNRPRAS